VSLVLHADDWLLFHGAAVFLVCQQHRSARGWTGRPVLLLGMTMHSDVSADHGWAAVNRPCCASCRANAIDWVYLDLPLFDCSLQLHKVRVFSPKRDMARSQDKESSCCQLERRRESAHRPE